VTHRRFVLIGAVGVVALVVVLMVNSLSSGVTYYLYPSEAVAQREQFADGTRFRLAGTVMEGSIVESGSATSFVVSDGAAEIPVDLMGRVPPLFADGVPVLVEGTWDGERFTADEAVIRHDENYSIPEEGGAFES
jgi:cytochrome c-type biogenesis protein CcmE